MGVDVRLNSGITVILSAAHPLAVSPASPKASVTCGQGGGWPVLSLDFSLSYTQLNISPFEGYALLPTTQAESLLHPSSVPSYLLNLLSKTVYLLLHSSRPSLPL